MLKCGDKHIMITLPYCQLIIINSLFLSPEIIEFQKCLTHMRILGQNYLQQKMYVLYQKPARKTNISFVLTFHH